MNTGTTTIKVRESGYEMLRIILMFMIVLWHICVHGVSAHANVVTTFGIVNQFLYYFILSITVVAVSVYILISGYFLNDSKFKVKRVVKLILQVFTFSMVIYIISIISGIGGFSFKSLTTSLFPIFFGKYWFVSVFIMLSLLSPYLNAVTINISRESNLRLLILLFFITCVWQFVFPIVNIGVNYGNGIVHFIFLYLIAGYVKRYGYIFKDFRKEAYLTTYIILAILNSIANFVLSNSVDRIFCYNSPVVLVMSYCLFMYFSKIKFSSKKINFLATSVFGVYLVHEYPMIRELLWNKLDIIENVLNGSRNLIIIKLIIYSMLIFCVCWVISYLITALFNHIFSQFKFKC